MAGKRTSNAGVLLLVIGFGLALLSACATANPEPGAGTAQPLEPAAAPERVSELEPAATPEPEPTQEPTAEPEPVPEQAPEPEPEPETTAEPEAVSPDFEVSDELYEETFDQIEQMISELNDIIAARDFASWQRYLTDGYRRTYSDPSVLQRSSQSAVLQRNQISLRSLNDYFTYVVAPSRANARLDDLVFVDEGSVEAIMEIGGERYLLYLLRNTGNGWKIDVF